MKFRVKEWERKWNKGGYEDVFNDIGVFDVRIIGHGDAQTALLRKDEYLITVNGVFGVAVDMEFLSFNGFIRNGETKYVQYRCYNE